MNQDLIYLLALQRSLPLNPMAQNLLVEALGSASEVFAQRSHIREAVPSLHPRTATAVAGMEAHLERARQEADFIEKHHIQLLFWGDDAYPARLREIADAPLLLYYLGNAPLNAPRVLSIVGSRQCTEYGRRCCQQFLDELRQLCPDVLVVSGLAYGIDIAAHRAALACGLPTLGVLAHGLDQIYPRMHEDTAREMVMQGGLLTEYQSGATADKPNFVARNRIVAAMADATLVVESKAHGGSLITTRLASEAGRRVFAVPGRTDDALSAGCNQLIADGKAELLLNARQLADSLGWHTQGERPNAVQLELFPELTAEQRQVVEQLQTHADGLTLNELTMLVRQPVSQLTALLFELELAGVIKMAAGNRYFRA